MKKILLLLLASTTLVACANEGQDTADETETSQAVETTEVAEEHDHGEEEHDDHDHDHDHDAEYAGVDYIVVQITEDGYAILHGDHFHSYDGSVPEDALIAIDLVTEEEGEVVSEHNGGQIVKVGEEYLFKANDNAEEYLRDIEFDEDDLTEDHDHDHEGEEDHSH